MIQGVIPAFFVWGQTNERKIAMGETNIQTADNKTWGLTFRDKAGYFLGELGAIILYLGVSNFLTLYFTDVAMLPMALISVIFLVSRLWDAINDPLLGRIADNLKPTKKGKYHRWIWAVPVNCLAYALLFVKIPGLTINQYFIWGLIIYNLYGMASTCCSVPFGALANVITSDPHERTTLAGARGLGEVLGGIVVTVGAPLFMYTTLSDGSKVLDSGKFAMVMAVSAAIACVTYMMVFVLPKERVPVEKPQKVNLWKVAKGLFSDRAFLSFSIVNILFMAAPMYMQNCTQYICIYYFHNGTIYSVIAAVTVVARLAALALMGKLAKKFGKKAVTSAGILVCAACYFILFFIHTQSLPVFLVFAFLAMFSESFLIYLVWAMITDVIENYVKKSGFQEISTAYALVMFFRKIGTTVAGVAVPAVLGLIGYVAGNVTPEVADRLYSAGTLGSGFMYLLVGLILAFVYPLGKAQVDALYAQK